MSEGNSKLYYSIGEVAKMFGVNTSLIRYWEKEFEGWIKPHRTQNGTRYYTTADVEGIRQVYGLVKIEGYTLQGAKDTLRDRKKQIEEDEAIRSTLLNAKKILEKYLTN